MKPSATQTEQLAETLQSFSKAFSCAVTESWSEDGSFLAKNGNDSVYSLFRTVYPQEDSDRIRSPAKISRMEFNKLLLSGCGFSECRSRKKSLSRTAGNLLFIGRRWRNPRNTNDYSVLEREYRQLRMSFPMFASCSEDQFMQALWDVCESWSKQLDEDCGRSCKSIADFGPEQRSGGGSTGCSWQDLLASTGLEALAAYPFQPRGRALLPVRTLEGSVSELSDPGCGRRTRLRAAAGPAISALLSISGGCDMLAPGASNSAGTSDEETHSNAASEGSPIRNPGGWPSSSESSPLPPPGHGPPQDPQLHWQESGGCCADADGGPRASSGGQVLNAGESLDLSLMDAAEHWVRLDEGELDRLVISSLEGL